MTAQTIRVFLMLMRRAPLSIFWWWPAPPRKPWLVGLYVCERREVSAKCRVFQNIRPAGLAGRGAGPRSGVRRRRRRRGRGLQLRHRAVEAELVGGLDDLD